MITPESDVGLAQEEGDADTEKHRGDADGDVVDRGRPQIEPCIAPSAAPRQARRKDADPWIAAMIGCGVANPGPERRRPLEPKVDPA
jgi:hypothetical protein